MDGVTVRALRGFDVFVGPHRATPTAPKPRQILAVLSLRCGETAGFDLLIDELWGDQPPRRAVAALQTHVYELRKDLQAMRARPFVLTRANGYAVDLTPDCLDVTRFDRHVAAGAAALDRDDRTSARRLLGEALAMSAGRPLAGVSCGDFLSGQVVRLQETRLRAMELRVEVDLLLGHDDEVIGDLRVLVADHPYHEGFVLKLMTALVRRGRRTEALEAYDALRQRLADELGVEPGVELRQLHRLVIGSGGAEAPPACARVTAATAASPARLPRDLPDFTGRDDALRRARAHLLAGVHSGAGPVVSVIGMPGVGKTSTAVHLGHAVRDHFPDGQLFLSQTDRGRTVDAIGLAERLLWASGIPAVHQDAASAFRSWCANRRVLVVLDDVGDNDQVQALLPAAGRCAAIVTRRSVSDLPGAHPVALEPMDTDDGVAFLARLVPGGRVDAEPVAAKGIVDAVGGLPLALRHVGQRLWGEPTVRLHAFLTALTDAFDRLRLSEVSAVGTAVHDRLHAAYLALPERDRRLFRLLPLLRENNFTTDDAGRAFLLDPVGAEMALLRLADAHLVRPLGGGRYDIHTLVRRLSLECLIAANG